jgi:hypothetical protein
MPISSFYAPDWNPVEPLKFVQLPFEVEKCVGICRCIPQVKVRAERLSTKQKQGIRGVRLQVSDNSCEFQIAARFISCARELMVLIKWRDESLAVPLAQLKPSKPTAMTGRLFEHLRKPIIH